MHTDPEYFFAAKYMSVRRIMQNSCIPASLLVQVSSKWAVVANEVILMTDMMTIMVMMVMIKSIYSKGSFDVNEVFMMTAHDSRGVLVPPDPKSDDGTRESTQEGVAS